MFSQLAVSAYLTRHDWLGQVKDFRELSRGRRDATLAAAAEQMPAATTWTRPGCGFYVWLPLPSGLDAKAMLPRAELEPWDRGWTRLYETIPAPRLDERVQAAAADLVVRYIDTLQPIVERFLEG